MIFGEYGLSELDNYEFLILGLSTWFDGDLQSDWEGLFDTFKRIKFSGKKVAIYGVGDQIGYSEFFVDGIGILGKIVVENGEIVQKVKDKNGIISDNVLTIDWHDWIDYWSVDFDFESKPEVIKFKTDDGKIEEEWTGNYVFENEWQSFRGKKGKDNLELKSSEREIASSKTKVAVKVVDIFGNDTMKILEVKI